MTVDKQCMFSPVAWLEPCDDVLDVSVVMGHTVSELKVERSSWLLEIDGDLVDRFGSLLNGGQLSSNEIDGKHFIFITSCEVEPLVKIKQNY